MFALEFLAIWGILLIISWLITGASIPSLYIIGLVLWAGPTFVVWAMEVGKSKKQEDEIRRTKDYLSAYNDGYYDCLRKIKQDGEKK